MFLPNFLEALALAVIVAKNIYRIILPQPAVELLEKFAALRLGDLRLRRALGQRTERVEVFKLWIADYGLRICLAPVSTISSFNSTEIKPRRFNSTRKSGHEMKNESSAGTCCA